MMPDPEGPCVVCGGEHWKALWGYAVCVEHAAAWEAMPAPPEHSSATGPELAAAWKRATRAFLGGLYLERKNSKTPTTSTEIMNP